MSHMLKKWDSQVSSYVVCFVGKGLGLIIVLGGFSRVV